MKGEFTMLTHSFKSPLVLLLFVMLSLLLPFSGFGQTPPPAVAEDDAAFTKENTPVIIDVLANDPGTIDPTTLKITTPPSVGAQAAINPDHTITYTPKPNTVGTDTFVYEVCASGTTGCDSATVTIEIALVVPIDIKPGSCPNPINVKSWGVLPVAILGTADFDVTEINVSSIRLAGVAPQRFGSSIEDVAGPFPGVIQDTPSCQDCIQTGPDGFKDLTLKFSTQAIVRALGTVNDEECIVLELTGELKDGTSIVGEDVVRILKKGNSWGWGNKPFQLPTWGNTPFKFPKWW